MPSSRWVICARRRRYLSKSPNVVNESNKAASAFGGMRPSWRQQLGSGWWAAAFLGRSGDREPLRIAAAYHTRKLNFARNVMFSVLKSAIVEPHPVTGMRRVIRHIFTIVTFERWTIN